MPSDTKANCVKCGALILRTTALKHEGRCVPCSRKKWHDPIRGAIELVGAFLIWPLAVVAIGSYASWLFLARYIPGTRANFKANLERGWRPDWPTICRLWSKARKVYAGPIGAGAEITPEWMLVRLLAEDHEISSADIRQAITPSDVLVSAYCVLALEYRGEHELLATLSNDVTESTAVFQQQSGCFGCHLPLGEFIKSHRDRAA